MKIQLTLLGIIAASSIAFADEVTRTTTTTTTTTGNGTITEYTPGSTFVVKETSGPVHYRYGKKVEYYSGGRVLSDDDVRTRIKIGSNVHVHYSSEGADRVISRIDLD